MSSRNIKSVERRRHVLKHRIMVQRRKQKSLSHAEPFVLGIDIGRDNWRIGIGYSVQRERIITADAVERGHDRARHRRSADRRTEPEAPDRSGQKCLLPLIAELMSARR